MKNVQYSCTKQDWTWIWSIPKATNNCLTWWNSLHRRLPKMKNIYYSCTKHDWTWIWSIPKVTNICTTWWNSETIAKHGEIQKQLNNTPNRNYKNYRSCLGIFGTNYPISGRFGIYNLQRTIITLKKCLGLWLQNLALFTHSATDLACSLLSAC